MPPVPGSASPAAEEADAAAPDAEATALLKQLGHDPASLDALATRCGLTPERLLAILLPLELEGRVAQLPGGLYQRLDRMKGSI